MSFPMVVKIPINSVFKISKVFKNHINNTPHSHDSSKSLLLISVLTEYGPYIISKFLRSKTSDWFLYEMEHQVEMGWNLSELNPFTQLNSSQCSISLHPENIRKRGVFRGCRNRTFVWNGLRRLSYFPSRHLPAQS